MIEHLSSNSNICYIYFNTNSHLSTNLCEYFYMNSQFCIISKDILYSFNNLNIFEFEYY